MEKSLVLASASPRRREILATSGYEFEIITSDAEEISAGMPASQVAMENALAKARDVYKKIGRNGIVIGADTVVCLGDEILGKPKDEQDAFDMLSKLSGSYHSVITGFAVIGERETVSYCETFVKFRDISEEEIRAYIATKEPMDKAGAYGIQERAGVFVESIKGDYFNIMGLPVADIYPILKSMGINPKWQKVLL